MNTIDKLNALRAIMRREGLFAYIVPGTDPHASEYMAAHWRETTWLTSFTGEAGTAVVTLDKAFLWTDSRYYLQAGIELKDTTIELMRESDIDCPTITQWLCQNIQGTVGVNPEMWSVNAYNALKNNLALAGLNLQSIDLIRPLWTEDRPNIPQTPLYEYPEQFAGESVQNKLMRMRTKMADHKADAMIVSALDEIAWLLNIRGFDVEYNPVVISYVVLEQNRCTLFVNPEKVDDKAAEYLQRIGVEVKDYEHIFDYIHSLQGRIQYDAAKVNEALFEAIADSRQAIAAQSPILIAKAHKNEVELQGERTAMEQDCVALTRFFKWLESKETRLEMAAGHITEWDLMEKLHQFRAVGKNFVEESFGTIAGYKGNGAIVHYSATADHCATVYPEGMLLLDSGGQYLNGTTDITRTIWLGGDIPAQAKRDYTLTMKGHLMLGHIRWPKGTRGNQLDALAKQYMWQEGITFGHGTGHGVGHFLGCHEGPQNVRTDMNPTVLEEGHICSDEPGIYRTDKWGIRIENLVAVIPAPTTTCTTTTDEWLTWETLTLCYYDTSLLDMDIMTDQEIEWINAYHEEVYRRVSPLLNSDEAEWLKTKCKKISL